MKTTINIRLILVVFVFTLLQNPFQLHSQQEDAERQKAFISMSHVNTDGNGTVHFKVYTKVDRKRVPVQFAVVNLYFNENSKLGMLGNITTDENGEGAVTLANKFQTLSDTLSGYAFIGSLMNDPRLEETIVELPVKPAKLSFTQYEEDSIRYVMALVQQKNDSGLWVPAEEVEVSFFIQRYFGLLPITEYPEYTDENGEATIEFPGGLKGDSLGTLTIVTKVNEHEEFGTYIASNQSQWGEPTIVETETEDLLSGSRQNAPLLLIIVANTIIIGVWVLILIIIGQLFRIKRLNNQNIQS
jgi:hypothetical protein